VFLSDATKVIEWAFRMKPDWGQSFVIAI